MSAELEIRLSGNVGGVEVTPDTLPLPELIHILQHFLAAVRAESDGIVDPNVPGFLSLAGIRTGSNRLVIETGAGARPATQRIIDALAQRDLGKLKYDTQESLRTAFVRVIRRGAGVQLVNGKKTPVFTEADPFPQVVMPSRLTEVTALLAYVNRIGNHKEPNAGLKLYNTQTPTGGNDITVRLSRQVAQRLATYLFQNVTVEGEATWITTFDPWRLEDFKVTDFRPFVGGDSKEPRPLPQVFSELADAAHGAWNDVDPEEYVSRLRSEE